MARLSRLLETKTVSERTASDSNLQKGEIYVYSPGGWMNFRDAGSGPHFCWSASDYGVAVIEAWGASGSGARQCCCAASVPGNPGAYARKTIRVAPGDFVCGFVGNACGNASALCFRNCGEATTILWRSGRFCSNCICAMGGRSGHAFCTASVSMFCCFLCCCFAGTAFPNAGCGIICNYQDFGGAGSNCGIGGPTGSCCAADRWMACAYGGDINRIGGFSCVEFYHCNACCICCQINYVKTSPYVFSEEGAIVRVNADFTDAARVSWYSHAFMNNLSGVSKSPTQGHPYVYCWNSGSIMCGCYETNGCMSFAGIGVPGLGGMTCNDVRDHGTRGGPGAVRIQYIRTLDPGYYLAAAGTGLSYN